MPYNTNYSAAGTFPGVKGTGSATSRTTGNAGYGNQGYGNLINGSLSLSPSGPAGQGPNYGAINRQAQLDKAGPLGWRTYSPGPAGAGGYDTPPAWITPGTSEWNNWQANQGSPPQGSDDQSGVPGQPSSSGGYNPWQAQTSAAGAQPQQQPGSTPSQPYSPTSGFAPTTPWGSGTGVGNQSVPTQYPSSPAPSPYGGAPSYPGGTNSPAVSMDSSGAYNPSTNPWDNQGAPPGPPSTYEQATSQNLNPYFGGAYMTPEMLAQQGYRQPTPEESNRFLAENGGQPPPSAFGGQQTDSSTSNIWNPTQPTSPPPPTDDEAAFRDWWQSQQQTGPSGYPVNYTQPRIRSY